MKRTCQRRVRILLATCLITMVMATDKFPKNFKFGVATSSYQIEGAWNVSGKGYSIWDYYTHLYPNRIIDKSNGDIACDSYHNIDADIANLKYLHVHFYRFSINWPRLLPYGSHNFINPDGVRYYNELIDKLIANGIEPMVTLYHWELPINVQDLGGWTNRLIVDWYAEYVRLCFHLFGDRVKQWITINEPWTFCAFGYETGSIAPFIYSPGIGSYLCGHHVLLAHAEAYHIYRNEFYHRQKGRIGITIETSWFLPKNASSSDDKEAATRVFEFHFGWFANPIFSKEGDYPKVMRDRIAALSKAQNFTRSRLPKFTEKEISRIQGAYDFLGLNIYTSFMVADNPAKDSADKVPSRLNDVAAEKFQNPEWPASARSFFRTHPPGMRHLLNHVKNKYGNPMVIITENGYAGFQNETIDDKERIQYLEGYLWAVLNATIHDKCNVQGYTHWSFMDNFEWADGYTLRFGLFYVDFEDLARVRTPKASASVYRNIIDSRQITN